jgi:hypothetical protein
LFKSIDHLKHLTHIFYFEKVILSYRKIERKAIFFLSLIFEFDIYGSHIIKLFSFLNQKNIKNLHVKVSKINFDINYNQLK